MKNAFRAQVSVEYLVIFIVVLGIALGAGSILLSLGTSASNLVPFSCSFGMGINCKDLAFASNSASTAFS